jgi:hypothetical protein
MDFQGTTALAELSRQTIRIGNPPVLVFNEQGNRLDRELIALSIQLRIASALERVATVLEANPGLVLGDIVSAVNGEGGQNRG